MNAYGRRLRWSLFGESHGPGVGVVLDGVPPGLPVTEATVAAALRPRSPGTSRFVSQRREPDRPQLLSGTYSGRTTGAPVCIWIPNEDADPKAYAAQPRLPRPGHADYTAHVASRGFHDPRGGGHLSGRLTAPLVAAGAIADLLLKPHRIRCAAHLHQVGDLRGPDHAHSVTTLLKRAARSELHTAHTDLEGAFGDLILAARKERDSLGGLVEFAADGLPAGLGDPLLDSVESNLAHVLFAIPAVKGVSFGAGFEAARMHGSEHNDPLLPDGKGGVTSPTNHAGGILGGRTTGQPLTGHVAIKPASTLPGREQQTVDVETGKSATLRMTGRHDPCIAIRAVPAVQAAMRLVLADFVLHGQEQGLLPFPVGAAATASQE